MVDEAQQKIDAYLRRLRGSLRGLSPEEIREIVEELRSHILERAASGGEMTASGVDSTLSALGTPEQLAREYVTEAVLARADVVRSPWRVLDGLFRWASLSIAGFFVLLSSIFGYFLGIVFILCAVLKPFHPRTAGLWLIPDGAGDVEISLRLGFVGAPLGGHEVLGWWIVPIGLVVGGGLMMLTTYFALWCAQQYRSSRAFPQR